jgi:hypothetical protein
MNLTIAFQMIAAEVLKLRRSRGPMVAALVLSVGIIVLYFGVMELRRNAHLGGTEGLLNGITLLGIYFGSFAAILIGTEAGTADVTSGVFRDLVATGRSRTALFLVRVPAAITVALVFTLSGFLVTVVATFAFSGSAPTPDLGLILRSAGWVVVATAVVTSLAVGVGSLTGSRSLTLTAVIGWQTIASTLLYAAVFLGSARDGVLLIALSHLRPGKHYGSPDSPGSSGALADLDLPMATAVAVLVILAWTVVPTIAGAWRTRNQDA